jgi:hypothetical protein
VTLSGYQWERTFCLGLLQDHPEVQSPNPLGATVRRIEVVPVSRIAPKATDGVPVLILIENESLLGSWLVSASIAA